MRTAGCLSVRQWLQENFRGQKGSTAFTDLWSVAVSVDYAMGAARTDAERFVVLSTNDQVEIQLRHIAAYIYEARTHDAVGASRIRGIVAPGAQSDLAPTWLVSEATLHSKQEHQRAERVSAELKRRGNKNDWAPDPKGKGKGKKGRGGGDGK